MALVERYHTQSGNVPTPSEDLQFNKKDFGAKEGPAWPRKAVSLVQSEERAKHVGILALEVYFPNVYVRSQHLSFRN